MDQVYYIALLYHQLGKMSIVLSRVSRAHELFGLVSTLVVRKNCMLR